MRILAAVGLALCVIAGAAHADKLIIDRVESKPSRLDGLTKVRALVSATVTGGNVVDTVVDPNTRAPLLKLKIGGVTVPFLHGAFEHAEVEVSLVVLIPTSYRFQNDFELMRTSIATQLVEPLTRMGSRVRLRVMGYGAGDTGAKSFVRAADARRSLDGLEIDASTDETALADVVAGAVSAAGRASKAAKGNKDAMTRAAVVVISSGIALSPDPDEAAELKKAITKVAEDAGKQKVRIHTIGYSPLPLTGDSDNTHRAVRPLLALGELSLQSGGTFRWVKTESGWDAAFAEVAAEIGRQQVVTFFAAPEEIDGKKLTVTMPVGTETLTSEPVSVGSAKCGTLVCEGDAYCVNQTCIERRRAAGGGFVVKALIFGGIGVGAMIALLTVLALVKRRRAAGQLPPAYAIHAGQVGHAMAGAPPPGVPYHGAPVAPAPPAPVPGGPVLIVLTGPTAGVRVPLRHGFTVGKAQGSDLDLSHDGFASGSHAQIVFDGSSWIVHDLGSTNGTFSNGVRISQQRLDPGTTVRFGSTEVRFWIG